MEGRLAGPRCTRMQPNGTLARMSKFPWLVWLTACTSAGVTRGAETAEPLPTEPTAEVVPAAPAAPEPPPEPPPAHPTFDALLPELGSTFARERDAWVVREVSHSEAGVERLRLARVTPTTTEVLFEDEPSPEATAALRTRLREHRRATRPNELVRERATATFSLDEYAPLVGLGAPLDRWLLFVETTNDLDRPEHVLHLIARDGSARHELARRPAPLGPCDGGGYYCERTQDECDEAGLRAEGRLCIQPASLAHVAVADGTLALLGGVHVAGHGGYPATSWVVALPPGL